MMSPMSEIYGGRYELGSEESRHAAAKEEKSKRHTLTPRTDF